MRMISIDNGQDIIDSRDIIVRIEELEEERTELVENVQFATAAHEISVIKAAEDKSEVLTEDEFSTRESVTDAEGFLSDWDDDNGNELKALQALAEEGEGCSDWPHGTPLIRDSYFEEYADMLQQDYTSVNFDNVIYWIRS
jgi:hypothetical protein